jgi:hypothetical protein
MAHHLVATKRVATVMQPGAKHSLQPIVRLYNQLLFPACMRYVSSWPEVHVVSVLLIPRRKIFSHGVMPP